MTGKIETGSRGEKLAAEFLAGKGFEVVARNYRWKRAEIDLIVQRDNWLVFVEVKTRGSVAYGYPESFISSAQRGLIFRAAENFIYDKNWQGNVRFDVISIREGSDPAIEHFEDAFNP